MPAAYMPAIVVHWIYGQELIKKLSSRGINISNEKNYLWGTQGPDLLFYHRLMPWQFGENFRKYGSLMHSDKVSPLFEALIEYLNNECPKDERPAALSYALGVCAHYALDSNAHPYVNWLVDKLEKNDSRGKNFNYHGEIESALDEIVLYDWRGRIISDMSLLDCVESDSTTQNAISNTYSFLLRRIYGVEAPKKAMDQIYTDELAGEGLLDNKNLRKYPFFLSVERIIGLKNAPMTGYMRSRRYDPIIDYANKSHGLWKNVHEQGFESNENFSEIMNRSLDYGVEFTEYFVNALNGGAHDFAAYTKERTFSYGVPSTPELT